MVKYLVMDVDGTLTDGKIYIGTEGEIFKAFDVKDGYAIHYILPEYDITPVIITGRNSVILEKRCAEIGIKLLFQGVNDKITLLRDILKGESLERVAYIGDDLNDVECMRQIRNEGGLIGCPSDAVNQVKKLAVFQSSKTGGNGAVREFIEVIINNYSHENV